MPVMYRVFEDRSFPADEKPRMVRASVGEVGGMPVLGFTTKRAALAAAKKRMVAANRVTYVIAVPESPTCDLWDLRECFFHGARHVACFPFAPNGFNK